MLDFLAVGIGVQVIVSVGQTAGAGAQPHHVHVTVLEVGLHANAKERVAQRQVLIGDEAGQVFLLESLDLGQVGQQGLYTLTVQTVTVHGHLVEVGNFLVNSTELVIGLAQFQEHVAQTVLVLLGQHVKHAIAGILGMLAQRVGLHPATTGILIEIFTRLHAQVHVGTVHAVRHLCLHTRHSSHHYGHS